MNRKILFRLLPFFFLVLVFNSASEAETEPQDFRNKQPVLVGRISYVEGQVLRYVSQKQDWVAVARDFPFGLEDSLYAEKGGKAELIMPNNTWVRVGDSTQIQLISLKSDITELDLATGIARFYNKDSDVELRVTTSFGYVLAPADTVFDMLVNDSSVEVIALKGTVDFVHAAGETKYEVIAGSSGLIADNGQVSSVPPRVEVAWEKWNRIRDNLWTQRLNIGGESVEYLPTGFRSHGYELARYGRWEKVYYEGQYRSLWRPTHVSAGWAPYTAGRWIEWYGDQCWIPDEPFGYVTHHYGSWAYVGRSWYWAPPVIGESASIGPSFGVSCNWYPGRVAWIYHRDYVGWLPLAHGEVYYSQRYWGPESVLVGGVGLAGFGVGISSYRYIDHAVIVNQKNFYNNVDYRRVRLRNVNPAFVATNYRVTQVINNDVIRGYAANSRRFGLSAAGSGLKSRRASVERIHYNWSKVGELEVYKAKDLRVRVNGLGKGEYAKSSQMRRTSFTEEGKIRHGKSAENLRAKHRKSSGGSKSKYGRSKSIEQQDWGSHRSDHKLHGMMVGKFHGAGNYQRMAGLDGRRSNHEFRGENHGSGRWGGNFKSEKGHGRGKGGGGKKNKR